MISNKQEKLILSLQKKKQRDITELFVVEGDKLVREYLESREEILILAALPEWLSSQPKQLLKRAATLIELSPKELKKISSLSSPNNTLAIVKSKKVVFNPEMIKEGLTLALDSIQDPGNLGTIIRIAAWFGIKKIVCSNSCVDQYNPKVLQATMGALLSVDIYYTRLKNLFIYANENGVPVYTTILDGESIYTANLSNKGILVFGNESKGVSDELLDLDSIGIKIPPGDGKKMGIESLNVASSVAVVCSEFSRQSKGPGTKSYSK